MATLDPSLYTVAWIAPLEIEVQAALHMLDRIHSGRFPVSPGDKYVYHAGEICGHNVIIATFAAGQPYGTNSATSLASHVRHYFPNLWFGLLVGVAAGLPNFKFSPPRDIRLGDVIVALPDGKYPAILPYGLGKQISANEFELLRYGHSLPQTEYIVGSAIGKIKASEQEANILLGYYKHVTQKAPKFSDPGQDKDILYLAKDNMSVPRQHRPDGERTRVWYGSIGSGDRLLKSSQDRDELRDKYHVIGLEMEAAGVLNEIPVGNIRGVCDYGDEWKNKDWQPYAAVMAAAYAKAVLSEIPPKASARLMAFKSDEDRSCLRDLQFTNPDDNRRRIEETKGGFFKGSFRWILDNAEYREWYNHQHSQILWIKGDAGKGKTMLIIGIIQELQQRIKSGSLDLLAYFLCQGTDERLNSATAALRGLIYMLIIQQPHLIIHLRKRYDLEGKKPFETGNAFYAFSAVFESMIQDIKQAPVYLLVDALDECKVGLSDMLSLISRTMSIQSAHLKWIVSSRNVRLVEQGLNLDDGRGKLSLELNAHHISLAIEKFIDHQVSRLDILKGDQSLRQRVKDQLYQKSDGTFLWVALVVNELGKCQLEEEVLDAMEHIPTDLPKLYDQMIEQIDQLKGRRRDVCLSILSMVVFAYRPLHLLEMCRVMNRDNVRDVENAVAMCGSFLTIRDKYIYLIHQSAKDHLDKIHTNTSILKDPSVVHYEIYSQSLQVLSTKLRRNIYCLDDPGVSASEIAASRPNPDPLFDLRYSCMYWLDHFLEVDCECVDMIKSAQNISDFFREHLLHWLESLSLIGEIRHGILTLRKLVHQQQVRQVMYCLTKPILIHQSKS
ncbi:hypothetical protein BJX63DRAFT_387804 [Aspergillus granulosus]|uniref:NACHT domain-containing protein n=1 Tax=Aspergillus granulosus TaxID=176169 RepID=A0ABR4HLC4_9EURO